MLKVGASLVLLLTAAELGVAQPVSNATGPQPYQGQNVPMGAVAPTPMARFGPAPGSTRPNPTGALPQGGPWNPLGGPMAAPAGPATGLPPQGLAPAVSGQGGGPGMGAGSGGFGVTGGQALLVPMNVRGYLGQPGIASAGLGPVQTNGAGSPETVIGLSGGAQLASTGYGASAQSYGFAPYVGMTSYMSVGPQPSVVSPAWTSASISSSQVAYGSLGPPFNYTSAVPAPGTGRPIVPIITMTGPAAPPGAEPQPIQPPSAAPVPVYRPPDRGYWFKLGKGGFGTSPTTPP